MLAPLIGHQHALALLQELLRAERFPHALLLHGPQGIGKRLLADHVAWRLILGPQAPLPVRAGAGIPAGLLAQLEAGSCPDLHLLTPEKDKKSIGVPQIRELLATLQRSADTARVVVVDALEALTTEAANMLLKTLEEPRPGIYFLLVCHRLHAALPTLRSRCRLLACHPLQHVDVLRVLAAHGVAASMATLARGAPGRVVGAPGEHLHKVLAQLSQGALPQVAQEGLIDALLHHVAQQPPSLPLAECYARLSRLQRLQHDLNLPAALVAEAALALLPKQAHVAHVD